MLQALSIPDSVGAVNPHAYRGHIVGFFSFAAAQCGGGQQEHTYIEYEYVLFFCCQIVFFTLFMSI
jgi:hypothetical protein